VAAGASVAVANRSTDRARSLAASTGVRAELFDPGGKAGSFVGIVVALAGPWPIGSEAIEALAASRTVIVDLSVPTAVGETAAAALGERLISADALALMGQDGSAPRDRSRARVDALIDRTTDEFLHWLGARQGHATAQALVEAADRERMAALAELWRRQPALGPEDRKAIEAMTRHLATRILREPLERLGRDADGRDERAVRDIFAL
jgi:glutamyl-tRNA reductase